MSDAIKITRTLTQDEFNIFAELSGDDNPIHVDPEFSARTSFGRTVSHGMLLYTILRGLVERLAPNANHIGQDLKFPAPAYADEELQFAVEKLGTENCQTQYSVLASRLSDGHAVCEGVCTVKNNKEMEA